MRLDLGPCAKRPSDWQSKHERGREPITVVGSGYVGSLNAKPWLMTGVTSAETVKLTSDLHLTMRMDVRAFEHAARQCGYESHLPALVPVSVASAGLLYRGAGRLSEPLGTQADPVSS